MKLLITGTAGFIGYHLAKRMLERGDEVVGLDSINNYYDPKIKYARLADCGIDGKETREGSIVRSSIYPSYRFIKCKLEDKERIEELFDKEGFDVACNLAAQAGVRHSLQEPRAYIDSNIVGFLNILEACRRNPVKHLVYASSSSVYGLNERMPFATSQNVDRPASLYAASKKSNELMAHSYSHLFGIPTTGLRFFTVYGPWGRPDMALFIFTKAIIEGSPIDVNNGGDMRRDFTFVDDIIEGMIRVIDSPPKGNEKLTGFDADPGRSRAPYRVYNIGRGVAVPLSRFIDQIESALGKRAIRKIRPLPAGDVPATWADTSELERDFDYHPKTDIEVGISRFVNWYRSYFGV